MLRATEIVIEQLLIGIIFLVILVMFLFGNPIKEFATLTEEWGKFVFTVLIIIMAYACGIVVDRWADTILEDYFQYKRLEVALKGWSYCELSTVNKDIFPVNRIRMKILEMGNGFADYHDYLRTRIRITRSLTCQLPAFFMACLLINCSADLRERYIAGFVTAAIYAFVIAFKMIKNFSLPKTYDIGKLMVHLIKLKPSRNSFCGDIKIKYSRVFLPIIVGIVLYTLFFGLTVFYFIRVKHVTPWIYSYLPFSVFTTLLTGDAWLRISKTFFNFLKDSEKFIL